MAKSQRTKRDEKRELSRRALIKWTVSAGAALGVARSKIFDIIEGSADKELAYAAAANPTTRSVHLVAGNGGLSWFTQFWPYPDIAAGATSSNQLAWGWPGMQKTVSGTTNPLTVGPATPWTSLTAAQQVTCFMCGGNETHTRQPQTTVTLNGSNIFSVATALQSASPSVIPIVTLADVDIGSAPGSAQATNVPDAASIVGLFNSAASQAGGLLAKSNDATLYKAQYDAFTQLNAAANRSTTKISYTTASGAAGFLGTNLAAQLAITSDDLTRYGITSTTRSTVLAIANALIVGVKAFKMGLTNCLVLPAMDDDPHDAFDVGDVLIVPLQLQSVFNAFMADLQNTTDTATGQALADDTVITIHGDTPKNCLAKAGWLDGTQMNTNEVFVYSAGYLNTGWYGSVDRNGNVTGFDANGKPTAGTYDGTTSAQLACASIAYAIAKGDERAISAFANGLTIGGPFGVLQTT
jgi:hypothetical protein